MACNSRSFRWTFLTLGIVTFGMFLAVAETPISTQRPPSDLGQHQQPPSPKPSSFAMPLRNNRRNLAAAPPSHLPSELTNASLPSRSGKEYSLPDLDKVHLLTQPRFQRSDFHDLLTPGLNKGKVRRATHTGFSSMD